MRLQFDRRLIYHFDGVLMLLMLAIIGLGTVSVYSADFDPNSSRASIFAARQAMWATMGVLAALAMVSFDYRKLERYAYVAYGLGLSLLLAVPIVGTSSNGSKRWIGFGAFSVQPSEMMKLALIVVLARYFHRSMRPEGLRPGCGHRPPSQCRSGRPGRKRPSRGGLSRWRPAPQRAAARPALATAADPER